jgi:hypothetical protein
MPMRKVLGCCFPMLAALTACGDSSSDGGIVPPNGSNVAAVTVDAGPRGSSGQPVGYVNGIFTTVTVCVPGTSNCQDIDHVLVDTGSSGLRLLANDGRAGGQLSLQLQQQRDGSGNPVVACTQFLDGFTWGPVVSADVKLAGETARVPIQVISETTYSSVPSDCSGPNPNDESNIDALMTNGILGVGIFLQDCGDACGADPRSGNNPGLYYGCSSPTSCSVTAVLPSAQVANPVSMFASDNNGIILQLPALPLNGAQSVSGSLIFGIDTQSNNSLGSATVLPVDPSNGTMTTVFNGSSYSGSFIDSGSNAIFFLSSSTTGMPDCPGQSSGFYCPSSMMTFSATNQGVGGSPSATFNFVIGNATSLFSSNGFAFANLGGPAFTGGSASQHGFDWGLSFFFGKSVYTAIEGRGTSRATGPFLAF